MATFPMFSYRLISCTIKEDQPLKTTSFQYCNLIFYIITTMPQTNFDPKKPCLKSIISSMVKIFYHLFIGLAYNIGLTFGLFKLSLLSTLLSSQFYNLFQYFNSVNKQIIQKQQITNKTALRLQKQVMK